MIIYSSKYYTKYNQIIKHYKELDLKKSGEQYTESHHILPKSMGGSNKKDNLVRVPARVHFLLHWMLYRIYRTSEMAYGWNMMCMNLHGSRHIGKSVAYARSIAVSSRIGKSVNKGKIHSAESKLNMSIAHKGKSLSDKHKARISASLIGKHKDGPSEEVKARISATLKGRTLTLETRTKISAARTGRIMSDETKAKISAAKKGKIKSAEHKSKLRLANTGKTASEETKKKMSVAQKQRYEH